MVLLYIITRVVCVIKKRLNLILLSCLSPNIFPIFKPQVMLNLCLHIKEFLPPIYASEGYDYTKRVYI